jgi:hypothetical protein
LKYNRFDPDYNPLTEYNHKFAPVSTPVRILERLSPIPYHLDLSKDSRIHDVVSILHLREFKGSDEDSQYLYIIDDKEKREAICIDGGRAMPRGIVQNLVQQKGYGPDDRIWQILDDLVNAEVSVLVWKASRAEIIKPRRSPRKSVGLR